jgi:hypothetical protein
MAVTRKGEQCLRRLAQQSFRHVALFTQLPALVGDLLVEGREEFSVSLVHLFLGGEDCLHVGMGRNLGNEADACPQQRLAEADDVIALFEAAIGPEAGASRLVLDVGEVLEGPLQAVLLLLDLLVHVVKFVGIQRGDEGRRVGRAGAAGHRRAAVLRQEHLHEFAARFDHAGAPEIGLTKAAPETNHRRALRSSPARRHCSAR